MAFKKIPLIIGIAFLIVGILRPNRDTQIAGAQITQTGTTEQMSISSSGMPGNAASYCPSISADGRYVAFASYATNLVNGDTNGYEDVFVRDRLSGITERVSISSSGEQGNNASGDVSISADGRYVAFWSYATNLVNGDTNGYEDVFVRDRLNGTTERVSISNSGEQGNGYSIFSSISSDGRYVAFDSNASNLISGDTNHITDVFVHDRLSGTTERVSVSSSSVEGNDQSYFPKISADGRYIAFESLSSNLVIGDTNDTFDIFVHDRLSDTTGRVSVSSSGGQGNDGARSPSISANGRFTTFWSFANNLVNGDTNNTYDVFIHDWQSGTTELAAISNNSVQGNGNSYDSSISADGRFVAFYSDANNLVNGTENDYWDIYVRDRLSDTIGRVSVSDNGMEGNDNSRYPSISADGRYVAFQSDATNLVSGDINNQPDIYLHDRGNLSSNYSISGVIRDNLGNPISGVTISDEFENQTITISDGEYALTGLTANSHTITPYKDGYTFIPPSRTVTVPPSQVNQDFVGTIASSVDLWVDHIEVSQIFLDDKDPINNNPIPLVENKLTVVRVFVGMSGATEIKNVDVRLSVASKNQPHIANLKLLHSNHKSTIDVKQTFNRLNLDDSVNFLPLVDWLSGNVTLQAEVDPANVILEKDENNNAINPLIVTFNPTVSLNLAFIPIDYKPPVSECNKPSALTDRIWSAYLWALKVYPTSRVSIDRLPTMPFTKPLQKKVSGKCDYNFANRTDLFNALISWQSTQNIHPVPFYGWLPANSVFGGSAQFVGGDDSPITRGIASYGEDDPIFGKTLFAHEFAHMLGRPHTKTNSSVETCESPTKNMWSDWPYSSNAKIQAWGIDIGSSTLFDPTKTYDYMSYCWYNPGNPTSAPPAWSSPFTYTLVFNRSFKIGTTSSSNSAYIVSSSQHYLVVSGHLFPNNSVSLNSTWVLSDINLSSVTPPGTQYCLDSYSDENVLLSTSCFDMGTVDDQSVDNEQPFFTITPYSEGTGKVLLRSGSNILKTIIRSDNLPTVNITYPNNGEVFSSTEPITVTWTANDIDNDPLLFKVAYSTDGIKWGLVADNITDTQVAINSSEIPGSNTLRFRVIASDGFNTVFDDTNMSITVGGKSPVVHIFGDKPIIELQPGAPLILEGAAYDLEDGTLDNNKLEWDSSLEGNLGNGNILLTLLSPGLHTIHLKAYDNDGNLSIASIKVFVGFKTYLPIIQKR
jgi:hypothetical protein